MALIDNVLEKKEGFNGYSGPAPTSEEEYNALLEEQDVFSGSAPTWAELQNEFELLGVQKARARSYPAIEEQLDMLWHAIDSGTLDTSSDFYTTLAAVKDANPKPE